jgi:hypothetical protein
LNDVLFEFFNQNILKTVISKDFNLYMTWTWKLVLLNLQLKPECELQVDSEELQVVNEGQPHTHILWHKACHKPQYNGPSQ